METTEPEPSSDAEGTPEPSESSSAVLYGDVNLDSVVNVSDALEVLKAYVGLETLSEKQQEAADVDGSITIDVTGCSFSILF